MPNNPFSYSDEIGFEQSTFTSKPKQNASDAAKAGAKAASQQVKTAAQDATNQFLDALYGPSQPSSDQNTDSTTQSSQQKGAPHQLATQTTQQPQSPAEQSKQAETQKKNDVHKQYFEKEIEHGMVKARRLREEEEQKKLQEEEEERQRKEQEKEEQQAEFIAPTGKATGASGRNRKGQRPLSVIQSQNKGETGRNVVAG